MQTKGIHLYGYGIAVIHTLKVDAKLQILLCERLRTHKVFRKDQCFYLNYHKFSIKSYVLDVY